MSAAMSPATPQKTRYVLPGCHLLNRRMLTTPLGGYARVLSI